MRTADISFVVYALMCYVRCAQFAVLRAFMAQCMCNILIEHEVPFPFPKKM